ncbi:MAG: hypothetical protein BGO07_00075 [Alphaproteobacteria bacterium 40-19]|nr:MAG: hypothetical protein BGO07_00075 [Alphaproteobacteria bacterium 40-19]
MKKIHLFLGLLLFPFLIYGGNSDEVKTPKSNTTADTEQNQYQQQNSLLSNLAQELSINKIMSQKNIDQILKIIKDPGKNLEQVPPYDIFRLACFIDQCATMLSNSTHANIEISDKKCSVKCLPRYQNIPISANTKIFCNIKKEKIKKENGSQSFNALIEYTIIDAKNNPSKSIELSQRNLLSMMLRIFNTMEEPQELEIWKGNILSPAAKALIREKFPTRSHELDTLLSQ